METTTCTSTNTKMDNLNFCQQNTNLTLSEIQSFYSRSTVFLTGGTGFVGGLILEKLLRTCPGLKVIYVLIRDKKGKTSEDRFKDLFNNPLFDLMKKETPDYLEKVKAVIGDCEQPNLGMKEHDREMLKNEVNIVIHSAATVRFDEHMRKAVRINIIALQDLLKISQEIRQLKAFVHISTAYSNCAERKIVEEKFYELPISGDDLIQVVNSLSDEYITSVTPSLLNKYANTYVMTKAIAEGEILKYGKGLPIGVVRPSMIIATANEPIRGWINNVYGPTGVVAAVGVGLMRTMCAEPKNNADFVPGDFVSNAVIVSARDVHSQWKLHNKSESSSNALSTNDGTFSPPIYNCVSTNTNPCTWEQFTECNKKHFYSVPFTKTIFPIMIILTASKFYYNIIQFLVHIVPAFIIDSLARLTGKKPKLMDAYKKIQKFVDVISYFSLRSWTFEDSNTTTMLARMSDQDRKLFDFDISKLVWDDYFKHQIIGVRRYILDDPMDTVPEALKRYKKLQNIYYTLLACVVASLVWIVYGLCALFL